MLKGRYIIVTRVGQGGMGAVYKASDTRENRLVAIKELSESNAANQAERDDARGGFRREAEMLARLNHRNLPRVYDFFEDSGKQYLVMDFVNGETLDAMLNRSPTGMPVNDVIKIADQLCDVLEYLHNQRPPIIFRDLKPGNIMVNNSGEVKLIDFGIARHFAAGKSSDTTALGTTGYAPPEQYGKGQTDARSDVYALGATLHALLTGRDPADNPFAFKPVRALRSGVPVEVEKAVMKAVEQDPRDRWPSAKAMKQALHALSAPPQPAAVASAPPVQTPAYVAPRPAQAAATPAPVSAPPQPAPAKPAPASSGHPISFWGALLLGAAVGATFMFGRGQLAWSPDASNFLDYSVYIASIWLPGLLAYVLAKRPIAAWAAWSFAALWNLVLVLQGQNYAQLVLPVVEAVILGWLMAIAGNRLAYFNLLIASGLALAAGRAVNYLMLGVPLASIRFRPEDAAALVIAVTAAWLVAKLLRR
jgi:serine/threonine protein kinase